ncbi:hypothetical protein [Arthrobacter sp. CJ23]|uniref:hypothetical protein n=1 Tax=Arthrobacter sp. CJ23 TaxID=2972479 RepID=UPI00215CB9C8|nr:hypothetical protein [Arthrobacter sp. CJ23]UVJ38896.1 hypothetical protein NVV90_17025 [Arthrobacter sp. CJ23]
MGEHNIHGEHATPKPARRASAAVVPILGLAAVLAGCVFAWNSATSDIGWFAYAPLSNKIVTGNGTIFVSQGTQIGIVVAALGLLLLAFWAGYRIGRQRPARRDP